MSCWYVKQILTDAALLKKQKLEIEELRKKLQVVFSLSYHVTYRHQFFVAFCIRYIINFTYL